MYSAAAAAVASVVSDSVQPHRRQPIGSPAPGILQARTLEWVAISFRGLQSFCSWKVTRIPSDPQFIFNTLTGIVEYIT